MSQRVVRVNELLKREISNILHTRYRSESVDISIIAVDVAPNLRAAKVFFATHGDAEKRHGAERFFSKTHESIRREMGKAVTLKFLPHLDFIYDKGADYGEKLNKLLDHLGLEGESLPEEDPFDDDY